MQAMAGSKGWNGQPSLHVTDAEQQCRPSKTFTSLLVAAELLDVAASVAAAAAAGAARARAGAGSSGGNGRLRGNLGSGGRGDDGRERGSGGGGDGGLSSRSGNSGGRGGSGSGRGSDGGLGGGGNGGVATTAGARAGPDLRAGDVVAGVRAVEVEDDAGVGVGVAGVEVEVLVRNIAARASDLELDARGVELSATGRVLAVGSVTLVVGNDLLADQVLASGQAGRQSEVGLALGSDELVNSPLGAIVAILGDLGPDGTGAIARGVGGNVGDDGALVGRGDDVVAAVVVVPLDGELVTGSGSDEVADGSAAVDVAGKVSAGQVLDGAVVGRASDVSRSTIALVDAVDPDAVDLGVGGNGAGHGQSGNSGVTHDDRWVMLVGFLVVFCK